ncbi:MAG: TatD family hydrolase [Chloroflexota bacterium]
MQLVDSHGHLQTRPFATDAADVLAGARDAGLARLLAPGFDVPTSHGSIAFARAHAGVDASVGVHPHVAAEVDDAAWARLMALARDPAVVAVGETGLDYDRGFSPREAQLANLRRHLALGWELRLPLILHCRSKAGERDAQDELLRELRAAGVGEASWRDRFGGRPPAVLHSFSGPVDYAETALAMGCAISFSGLVFRKGEEPSAEVARIVPDERLLTETDSPYLSPPGADRRRNEPRWVAVTHRWLAERRGADPDALGTVVVAAYDRFVGRGSSAA